MKVSAPVLGETLYFALMLFGFNIFYNTGAKGQILPVGLSISVKPQRTHFQSHPLQPMSPITLHLVCSLDCTYFAHPQTPPNPQPQIPPGVQFSIPVMFSTEAAACVRMLFAEIQRVHCGRPDPFTKGNSGGEGEFANPPGCVR